MTRPELPKRKPGRHLPQDAYKPMGIAKVPNVDPYRFLIDEKTLMVIINGLRRWQINDGPAR